jgi:hypothetical protein
MLPKDRVNHCTHAAQHQYGDSCWVADTPTSRLHCESVAEQVRINPGDVALKLGVADLCRAEAASHVEITTVTSRIVAAAKLFEESTHPIVSSSSETHSCQI